MKYISIIEAKDGVVKLHGSIGCRVDNQILPATIEFLKDHEEIQKAILVDLNGVDLDVYANDDVGELLERWDKKLEEKYRQDALERQQWLKSEEGQKYLAEEEAKRQARDTFMYKDFNEAMRDLSKINYTDFTSSKTSKKDAQKTCKDIMSILQKCEDLKFNEEQQKDFSSMLKSKGCVPYKQANEKFFDNDGKDFGEKITQRDSIEFPLSVFAQLIDTSPKTFKYGMSRTIDGGEYSWVSQWLDAQNTTKELSKE